MKNANCYQSKELTTSPKIDEMLERGRKLHSEAVFMGILKIITLFKPATDKTMPLPDGQKNMGLSQ